MGQNNQLVKSGSCQNETQLVFRTGTTLRLQPSRAAYPKFYLYVGNTSAQVYLTNSVLCEVL